MTHLAPNGNGGIYLPKWAARALIAILGTAVSSVSAGAMYLAHQTRQELREYIIEKTTDRYTGKDAARDIQIQQERFGRVENRMDRLEKK